MNPDHGYMFPPALLDRLSKFSDDIPMRDHFKDPEFWLEIFMFEGHSEAQAREKIKTIIGEDVFEDDAS